MFSSELKTLLAGVITSWQVLAVTLVLILYIFLVNFVASTHRRSRPASLPKKQAKSKGKTPETPDSAAPRADSDDNKELGLEEKKDPEEKE